MSLSVKLHITKITTVSKMKTLTPLSFNIRSPPFNYLQSLSLKESPAYPSYQEINRQNKYHRIGCRRQDYAQESKNKPFIAR
jgi:hypothetical protein